MAYTDVAYTVMALYSYGRGGFKLSTAVKHNSALQRRVDADDPAAAVSMLGGTPVQARRGNPVHAELVTTDLDGPAQAHTHAYGHVY